MGAVSANSSALFSHKTLIGAMSVTNTEGLDLSVSFARGVYKAHIGDQSLTLPLDNKVARRVVDTQCPNLSPRFTALLVILLSHRSWDRDSLDSYPEMG